ncbi:hypothetical protein GKZ89_01365 [Bacillus mangrovi]|uniref:Uncharacterized protein n=1 Tax=Metabacillus mangrovi TaxID=1491830 RepID=A0A7X2S1I5_9BACI|nr:hypothetical protein [Metabacillus mangrovi]MTH52039.1 hypothetical protein [Metabacillus mangrovi]
MPGKKKFGKYLVVKLAEHVSKMEGYDLSFSSVLYSQKERDHMYNGMPEKKKHCCCKECSCKEHCMKDGCCKEHAWKEDHCKCRKHQWKEDSCTCGKHAWKEDHCTYGKHSWQEDYCTCGKHSWKEEIRCCKEHYGRETHNAYLPKYGSSGYPVHCTKGIKEELERLTGRTVLLGTTGGAIIGIVGRLTHDTVSLNPIPGFFPATVSLCDISIISEQFAGPPSTAVSETFAVNKI